MWIKCWNAVLVNKVSKQFCGNDSQIKSKDNWLLRVGHFCGPRTYYYWPCIRILDNHRISGEANITSVFNLNSASTFYLFLTFVLFIFSFPFSFLAYNLFSLPLLLSLHPPSASTSLHPSNLSDSLIHLSFPALCGRPPTLLPIYKWERETERDWEREREGIHKYKKAKQLQHSVRLASLYITRPAKQIVSDV